MSQIITIHDLSHGHTTYTKVCDRIYRVGIELEGNFEHIPDFNGSFHTDGSVNGFERFEGRNSAIGEYVSNKLEVSEVMEWIENCHPTQTNRSCGGHIHISLNSLGDYMTLMTQEFYDHVLEKLAIWGHKMHLNENSAFWDRIGDRGVVHLYNRFNPRDQKNMRRNYMDERYSQINYAYNLNNRHTIEFRMLPCFNKKSLQIAGTMEIIKITQEYLENKQSIPVTMRIKI